jgi:hypothetical protein
MNIPAHIPTNNGKWSDPASPGNSVWLPDMSCVPHGSNDPYHPKKFRTLVLMNILKPVSLKGISLLKVALVKTNMTRMVAGLAGVRFINNEPQFWPYAIATVKLQQYLDCRYGSEGTMPEADRVLAAELGVSTGELRQWINDNQYVWHERQDGRRIDLISHDIHGNIPHTGGISVNKMRHGK